MKYQSKLMIPIKNYQFVIEFINQWSINQNYRIYEKACWVVGKSIQAFKSKLSIFYRTSEVLIKTYNCQLTCQICWKN